MAQNLGDENGTKKFVPNRTWDYGRTKYSKNMSGNLEFGQWKKQNLDNLKNNEVFHHIIRMINVLTDIGSHVMETTTFSFTMWEMAHVGN